MARIFISYAREDFKPVKELHQRPEGEGFIPWMDKVDLIAGKRWRPAIEQAIRKTDFFVICLSNHSVKKRSFVQREIKMAVDLWQEKLEDDVYLIPVLLEFVEPEEIPEKLRDVGWVFLYEEDGWDELLRALKHGMKQHAIDSDHERRREDELRRLQEQLQLKEQRKAEEGQHREAKAREEETQRKAEVQRQLEAKAHQEEERKQREAKERRKEEQRQREEKARQEEARLQREEKRQHLASLYSEEARRLADDPVTSLYSEEARRLTDENAEEVRRLDEQKRLAEEVHQREIENKRHRGKLRRRFFTLAIELSVLLLSGALVVYWIWPSGEPPQQSRPVSQPQQSRSALSSFSYETVKLDHNGKEISRETKQARYFTEDLGNGVTLDMVEIPGGSFTMGSPTNEANRNSDEGPQHFVMLPLFWLGKFEVTQKQWQAVMGNNPSNFNGDDSRPVEQISWNDAQEFLERLNDKLGLKEGQLGYRLPSEAEWEYAARADTKTPFAFGDTITPRIVNYEGNYPYADAPKGESRGKTIPVGSLGVANAFGLFDMHGNVWEWCQDTYPGSYPKDGSVDRFFGPGNKVLRGGSWVNFGDYCRSALRLNHPSGTRNSSVGVRVVLSSRTQ